MLLNFFLLFFTPASVRPDWDSNLQPSHNHDDLLEKGILFHERGKILLAEKFVLVEFMIPFPTYDFALKHEIERTLVRLGSMWDLPSLFCPLNFSTNFNSNSTPFNVHWILEQINHEINEAANDVILLRNETSAFLSPPSPQRPSRQKRGASVGAVALAAVGLFGGGVALGSSGSCGLQGIFGTCQDQSKANAENIRRLSDFQDILSQYVTEFSSSTENKFFLIENELAAINEIQADMTATQNKNWALIEQQFAVFERNFHVLRDCDQMLFSNQQLNFNFDTLSSLLSLIHASVKSFRAALFAFRINVLNSIPVLLRGHLPMSLVPLDSLLVILESVVRDRANGGDRLSLAIPMSDLLSYYDSRLLADAVTVSEGFLLTLNIPLASRQTVFSLFEAKLIPMPFPDDSESALMWDIEVPFLAISENLMESSPLSASQVDRCLGSSRYRICSETIPTEIGHSSCLATLYFESPMEALSVCDTKIINLPTIEQATNLGFGIWLITSASNKFNFRESMASSASTKTTSFPGCHICLITLECGMQIMTPNIKLRSDLSSCTQVPAIKLEVSLPNPLQSLIMEVPPLDDLLLFNSRTEAGVKLLKQVKTELARGPKPREVKHLVEIARPFASNMKLLKPSLVKEFNQYVPFKVSFMLTLTVFVFSTALHLLFMYIYHRYNLATRVPKIFDDLKRKLPLRQMVDVPTEHENKIPSLQSKHGDRYHFQCASSSKISDAVDISSFHTKPNPKMFSSLGPNEANHSPGNYPGSLPLQRANGFGNLVTQTQMESSTSA